TATILGAPTTSPEGTAISLSSLVSDPGSADTHSLSWSVSKNGSAFASGTGVAFGFTPDDNGSYVVTLTATDDDGGVGSVAKTITVTNLPPAVNAGPDATINAGSIFTSTGSFSDPGTADTWTATVNYGDG